MKLHPNLGAAGTHLVPVSLTTVISPNGIVKTDSSEQLDQQSVIKSDYLVVIVGRWQQRSGVVHLKFIAIDLQTADSVNLGSNWDPTAALSRPRRLPGPSSVQMS